MSEDLATFLAILRERTCQGRLWSWLQDLTAQANAIWAHRRGLALRPYQAVETDTELAAWLVTLPTDAYVYDLRTPTAARGWPYGLAGPNGRLFRYGRRPVFAVAGPHSEGSRIREPEHLGLPSVARTLVRNVIPWRAPRLERIPATARVTAPSSEEQRLCA